MTLNFTNLPINTTIAGTGSPVPLTHEEIEEMDDILEGLRAHNDEIPHWEFCEGFLAALVACRRIFEPHEYFPVLFDIEAPAPEQAGGFADVAQAQQFMALWNRHALYVQKALQAQIEDLSDERAYYPHVIDLRGMVADLPPDARKALAEATAQADGEPVVPAYGQIWAVGFMYAVETWPEEWDAPRDKAAALMLDGCLQAIVLMTEDDTDPPTISVYDPEGPPGVSESRLGLFTDALWAVYDLYALWREFGPRVSTVYKVPEPGRNDLCNCGSGKKYKKCCGA